MPSRPALDSRRLLPAGLVVALAVAGLTAPGIWPFVATFAIVQAVYALSAGMLYGRAGLLSLCTLTFAFLGHWAVLWLDASTALPFTVAVFVAGGVAVPPALLLGGLALRLRGVYLAIITWTFANTVNRLYGLLPRLPSDASAYRDIRPTWFGSDRGYYLFALGVLLVVGGVVNLVGNRTMGHTWRAVRHSERATAALGRSVAGAKLSAFVVSGMVAAIGGAVYAGQLRSFAGTSPFAVLGSLMVIVAALMAGAEGLTGALLAGILVAVSPELFRRLGWPVEYPTVLFAVGAVVALLRDGEGLASRAPWHRPRPEAELHSATPTPPPAAIPTAVPMTPVRSGRADSPAPALQISDLRVTFGSVVAVDGLCLTVPANTVLGLMGPNGSGKSTVIDAVTGFVGHERGRIEVGGSPIDHLGATRRARAGVRRTFQQGRAVPTLTVGQYLRLAASDRLPGANLARLIDHFDLPAPDRPVRLVDAGTRRILELAAALAGGPTVVFADEPAAGLGPEARAGLADAIRAIPERFGCSVVCVEHDLDLLVACCDEILVLDLGRALVQATPPAVMADPLVRAAMLGA